MGHQWTTFLKTTDTYYTQIQMQIQCTDTLFGIFVIYTSIDPVILWVNRDQKFLDKLIPKLIDFYDFAVIPEIVDPRRKRHMKLREPKHVQDYQDVKKAKEKDAETAVNSLYGNAAQIPENVTENAIELKYENVEEEMYLLDCENYLPEEDIELLTNELNIDLFYNLDD